MLETSLRFLKYLGYRHDDDWVDRLHNFLTSNLCLALSMLISFKQFGGKPIECMLPKMFPGSWEDYAENYCWAQNMYFLTLDIDVTRTMKREHYISYYQWVPFFLVIVAASFRLPSLAWRYLAGHSGIRIHDIVRVASDERNIEAEVKEHNLKALTVHIQNALRFHRRLYRRRISPHKFLRFLNLPYTAVYVTFMYILTKMLYLVNVWLQLVLMNKFLHTEKYQWYGWGAMADLLSGVEWKTSGMFPRVTLCDFEVRGMGNLQNYTVQCVLVINIFNEKIFIFLWFWFVVLMFLTSASMIYWLVVTLFPWPGRWFITHHLELSDMPFDPKGSAKEVERFVGGYLKTDGVFVLRMITMHSGIIFGTDLVLALWRSFYGIEEKVKRANSYLTPSPTERDVVADLRQRSLKEHGLTRRKGNDKDSKKSSSDADSGKGGISLVKAASEGSAPKSKRGGVLLLPTAPGLESGASGSKATTLEASKKERKLKKPLQLVIPMDSDDDDVITHDDVEKGAPLIPRSRGSRNRESSSSHRTSSSNQLQA